MAHDTIKGEVGLRPMESFDVRSKRVLLRLDINSPIDPSTKRIVNTNRIEKSLPTVTWLIGQGARVAIIAHQGDTLDYQNLIPMREHAEILSRLLGTLVPYVDDVCGPTAQQAVLGLQDGEVVLLGNLRYLSEEISTFEDAVKLRPDQMLDTWLVRTLAPLFDLYVNDAFSAAHRNCPSMTAFQEVLPSAAGPLFFKEVSALTRVLERPERPALFVLGGAKISDAFGMMGTVLENGTADTILVTGVTGEVFLAAAGVDIGPKVKKFLADRSLDAFIPQAADFLERFTDRFILPVDLAFVRDGIRKEVAVADLPVDEMFMDIGQGTIDAAREAIMQAGSIFVNGPAGVFEDPLFEVGTRELWRAIAAAPGYTVIGGGDSVSAGKRFSDLKAYSYVCTAGGAMVRFLSGKKLPLIEAMERASQRVSGV